MKIIKSIINRLSRQHHKPFSNSYNYWNDRYNSDGNSGEGSYGVLADFKATVLNQFIEKEQVNSVIEYGCGDGNQLRLAQYPPYIGFDISPTAIEWCRKIFSVDSSKRFKSMLEYDNETADLTISLDVIYHLIEDNVFETYMHRLFDSSDKFVIIYSSDFDSNPIQHAPHVRHRQFTKWVRNMKPEWLLKDHVPNKFSGVKNNAKVESCSDFFIYQKN